MKEGVKTRAQQFLNEGQSLRLHTLLSYQKICLHMNESFVG